MTANEADNTVKGRRLKFIWWYYYFIVQCCIWKSVKRKTNLFKTEFEMAIDESQWETNWRKQWLVVWMGCQCQTSNVQQDLDLPNIRLKPHAISFSKKAMNGKICSVAKHFFSFCKDLLFVVLVTQWQYSGVTSISLDWAFLPLQPFSYSPLSALAVLYFQVFFQTAELVDAQDPGYRCRQKERYSIRSFRLI